MCPRTRFKSLLEEHDLLDIANPLSNPTVDQSIFQTLYIYDKSQCEDPRDRVFAVRSLSRHSYMIPVDYNRDVRDTYLNLVRGVVLWIVDVGDFTTQFMGSNTNTLWGWDRNEAILMFAMASCKKKETTDQSDYAMESWLPDWTVKTQYDSVEHRQAVEFCFPQGPLNVKTRPDSFKQRLIESRNGYTYFVISSYLADPRTWPREDIMRSAIEQIDDHESLKSWVESMYSIAKSYCVRPGAELNRIWLPMTTHHAGKVHSTAMAFFIRPSRRQSTIRDIPVYQLQRVF